MFEQLQALLLDELGAAGRVDLERVSVDSFSLRAVKWHPPADRPAHDRDLDAAGAAPVDDRAHRGMAWRVAAAAHPL